MTTEEHFMSRALHLARRGLWTTDPNPRVGCVLVQDGDIVGEGWHEHPGGPHAEVNAITNAGAAARNASAYISLEPCCHHGKTGPCTDALIEAGIKRVVTAMVDPNPLVAGNGLKRLAGAGIETRTGLLESSARELNPGFCSRMSTGLPYVRAKLAMSLDARTAMASGESQWITGAAARRDVQRLRARSSAVMTGVGTVLADNPSLTVRAADLGLAPETRLRQPLRVIVDSTGRTPTNVKMFTLPGRNLVATSNVSAQKRRALEAAGAEVMQVEGSSTRVDLKTLLRELGRFEVNEILLECGPTLAGAMLAQQCIDELVLYVAPRVLGDNARGLFSLPGLEKLADAATLDISDVRSVGKDVRIIANVVSSA
jgi:diaminohydroxyphosphoribosylaminopyrimidine deaminase/5-amino-6-(5-phosphoribosylamino)uracil reductase